AGTRGNGPPVPRGRVPLPLTVGEVEPQPQRIPEILRPVEPRNRGGEIVVIGQGRRPPHGGEVVGCQGLEQGERPGGPGGPGRPGGTRGPRGPPPGGAPG